MKNFKTTITATAIVLCFVIPALAESGSGGSHHFRRQIVTDEIKNYAVTEKKIRDGAIGFNHLSEATLRELENLFKSGGPGIPFCFGFFCPDLVPAVVAVVPEADRCEFCSTHSIADGRLGLEVAIKNQGMRDAGPSITRVIFDPGGTGGAPAVNVDVPTTPIPIGFTVERHDLQDIPFPPSCGESCEISFCADADLALEEKDETNNCQICDALVL